MALIFEDDISFELSNYWNFSLNEVIRQLPRGWNVIQLCLIRNENLTDVQKYHLKHKIIELRREQYSLKDIFVQKRFNLLKNFQ